MAISLEELLAQGEQGGQSPLQQVPDRDRVPRFFQPGQQSGIFASGRGDAGSLLGIPGLGPLAPEQAKVGLFNITGGRIQRAGEEMLDTARTMVESTGAEWSPEMEDRARELLQGTGGIPAILQMADNVIANSPEQQAIRAQNQADGAAALLREEQRHEITMADAQLKKGAIARYGHLWNNIPAHNTLTSLYGSYGGDLENIDDLLFMNERFGTTRFPIVTDDLRGALRGAYRVRTRRLFTLAQRLGQSGVITPGEIPFITEFFPTFDEWTSDFTEGERRARLVGLREWLVEKMQQADAIIPGQNPFRDQYGPIMSGRQPRNDTDVMGILGIPPPPDTFTITETIPDPFAERPEVSQGLQNMFQNFAGP